MASLSTPSTLAPLLGSIAEVCIVTPDHLKTLSGLSRLGIGPFQIFDFTSETVPRQFYRGAPSNFSLKVCFAKQNGLVFEVMEPVSGDSLMADYLRNNGGKEGVQHIAFDMGGVMSMEERKRKMRERGFEVAMEGWWVGKKGECHFCFFDTEGAAGTVFETIEFSEDWEDPECVWWPEEQREEGVV